MPDQWQVFTSDMLNVIDQQARDATFREHGHATPPVSEMRFENVEEAQRVAAGRRDYTPFWDCRGYWTLARTRQVEPEGTER